MSKSTGTKPNKHLSSAIHKMNLAINKKERSVYNDYRLGLWLMAEFMIETSHRTSMIEDKRFFEMAEKLKEWVNALPILEE